MTERLFPELKQALREVLDGSGQDDQFRRQFTQLIANAYENNADRKDVELLLEAIVLDDSDAH